MPNIAVYTSSDTDDLAREKGFTHGLWEILRPFGDRVQGKVTIRDSVGVSRTWDDFAVRFTQLGDGLEVPKKLPRKSADLQRSPNGTSVPISPVSQDSPPLRTGGDIEEVEKVVERHLAYSESISGYKEEDYLNFRDSKASNPLSFSPFYTLYMKRLLSAIPLAPHETWSHPVACIIAISSRNPQPIEALGQLYEESFRGNRRVPVWVNPVYLRYYVLVHDEERDDINESTALFDRMKRHFGIHCHLLRLRSTQCVPSDDDSLEFPPCQWLSATEELSNIEEKETQEDIEAPVPCIFESDATAIRTFIREMVTQSVVPSMERSISTWNDQVASRRRGITGRFMSLSKKWVGFGGGNRNSSGPGTLSASSSYDPIQGFYPPEAPEAIMRKLADYAFMLRDWKLAQSTYELLRSDFNNDKAWKYHAAANEMTAISTLLIPKIMSARSRAETVDQMLETASYSYVTRCGATYGAFRCLALGMELLRLKGGSAADDAARWGTKLLELRVAGGIGDGLIRERVSVCYATRKGSGLGLWGARTRKAAMWSVLAADTWYNLGKYTQASLRLAQADSLYGILPAASCLDTLYHANDFLQSLRRDIGKGMEPPPDMDNHDGTMMDDREKSLEVEEESEALDTQSDSRRRGRSLMGAVAPQLGTLETAPLSPMPVLTTQTSPTKGDDFE